MSTRVDDTKLIEEPPLLKTEITDLDRKQQIEGTVAITAKAWDIYRLLVQLSFYWRGKSYHFLLCDDPDWPTGGMGSPVIVDDEFRQIKLFQDEEDLVRAAFDFLNEVYEQINDMPMFERLMVGWHVPSEIWPFLVNRAFKYKIPVCRGLLIGLDTRWPVSRYFGDIAAIYLQGGNGRKLPGLADLLRFWGYSQDGRRPLPEDIATAVCDDPTGTATEIERYLKEMHEVACTYYGANNPDTHDPRAGAPVPGCGELP